MLPQTLYGSGTTQTPESTVGIANLGNTTPGAVALSQAVSAGTPTGTINSQTFTGNALSTHIHTLTPSGTINSQNYSGTATSVVQPYITVCMWKRTA